MNKDIVHNSQNFDCVQHWMMIRMMILNMACTIFRAIMHHSQKLVLQKHYWQEVLLRPNSREPVLQLSCSVAHNESQLLRKW
jgi:hypothetical protein